MINFITNAVQSIWGVIKEAAGWIWTQAIQWVKRQFINLYTFQTKRVDEAVELACLAIGIPKGNMPPKMQDMINQSMRDTADYLDKQRGNIVDFIMKFNLCGNNKSWDIQDIVFDDRSNCVGAQHC